MCSIMKCSLIHRLPFLQVLTLLFVLVVPFSMVHAGDESTQVSAALSEYGQARVIVTLQVDNIKAMTASSLAFSGQADGSFNTGESPDAVLKQAISAASTAVMSNLPENSYSFVRSFQYTPAMVMKVNEQAWKLLQADNRVLSIQLDHLDRPLEGTNTEIKNSPISIDAPLLNESTDLIGASDVWAKQVTGAGVYVAVLDTGVLTSHEMFAGKNIVEACFSTTNADSQYDSTTVCPNGQHTQYGSGSAAPNAGDHGTHVAGISLGYNQSPTTGEAAKGVAYQADLIAIQIFSEFNSTSICGTSVPCYRTYTSDQISALEYIYSIRNSYNIGSINMSLGGGAFNDYCDSTDSRASIIETLRNAKIPTAIATGNDGYCGYVSAPACIRTSIAVGATMKTDQEASYNNYHSTLMDVFAPGSGILSAVSTGNSDYEYKNGTSMATPHMAGALALYKQANPDASVNEMEDAFKNNGKSVQTGCLSGEYSPRIQLLESIPITLPTYTVTPAVSGSGGSITPSTAQTVTSGNSLSFTLSPDSGYMVKSVDGTCGGNLSGSIFTTNPVSADCTVIASFKEAPTMTSLTPIFFSLLLDKESEAKTSTVTPSVKAIH